MMIHNSNPHHIAVKMPYGFDLSGYNEEIMNHFEARANELRRLNYNPSIQLMSNQDHNSSAYSLYGYNFCRSSSTNSLNSHFIDTKNQYSDSVFLPSNLVIVFREYKDEISSSINNLTNNEQIVDILNELIRSSDSNKRDQQNDSIDHCLLNEIANDSNIVTELLEIYSQLINFVLDSEDQQNLPQPLVSTTVLVLETISILFDLGDVKIKSKYSDEMSLSFASVLALPQLSDLSLFGSTDQGFKEIVKGILIIIILFAKKSEYAQNCLICFGIQSTIIDNVTNIMRTIAEQLPIDKNILEDLNNMDEIDIENLDLSCTALKEISAYSDKFDDLDISSILDSFIELIRLGIENEDSEEGFKITQTVLENCFSNENRSFPFIIKEAAFDCLTGITNRKSSDSVLLCKKGLHLTLLNILDLSLKYFFDVTGIEDPSQCEISSIGQSKILIAANAAGSSWGSFVSSLLKLIGNTVSSQQNASSKLIENGLVQMLMTLIQLKNCFCSECTHLNSDIDFDLEEKNCQSFMSEAFWILSNMLVIVPEILVQYITTSFIQNALSQAIDAPVGIKREISVFIATCILSFTYERVCEIFDSNSENGAMFFELMDEMISSGRNDIIVRCIDAMINLILLFSGEESTSYGNNQISYLLSMIDENGIMKDLEELMEEGDSRATSLYNQILRLSSSTEC